MIKALIIDDEQHAINALADHLKPYSDYTICGTAKTLEEAIALTKKTQPNLVFLDVVLGSKTGFDYLNAFTPTINFDVIFTTAYNKYAAKAFKFSALHYLLKPINADDFKDALSRVEDKITQQEHLERLKSLEHNFNNPNGYKCIHLPTSSGAFKVESKHILYIKSESNYADFFLTDERKILISKTLKYCTELLEESHFYRVHKSYLINTKQMKAYNKKTGIVTMNDGTPISVAVRKQKDFFETYFSGRPLH
ncbi:LytR/AlgR family response regulator transcription factor [Flavisericum labens]|uniref:LytR/AlgR family response regulator transcription factor n=1 Tax=Flavisericum labens TaxID=3377112 RepID=UPI00387AAB1E